MNTEIMWTKLKVIFHKCSTDQDCSKNFEKFQKSTYVGVYFNKVAGLQSTTLLKSDFVTGVLLWIFAKFLETVFPLNTDSLHPLVHF